MKRKINHNLPDFTKDLVYGSYGSCPLNAIAAMLGRHGYTMLTYNDEIVDEFEQFVKRGKYMEKIFE